MALSRIKNWIAAEILTAADLNAELNNFINNALSLISPWTGTMDANGNELILDADGDTSITADTDDQIDIRLAGADEIAVKVTGIESKLPFAPQTTELTISTGSVTPIQGRHTIDTEADAASDDLSNIVTTNMSSGSLLYLFAENASRVVTVKNAATGAGEVHTKSNTDIDLNTENPLILMLVDGTDWYEVQRPTIGTLVQRVKGGSVTYSSTATVFPVDNTIPQNTEGAELFTVAITPTSTANILRINVNVAISGSGAIATGIALFQDSTAGALAARPQTIASTGTMMEVSFTHEMTAGTISETTFKVRGGPASGTAYFNGDNSTRIMGGVVESTITVEEFAA